MIRNCFFTESYQEAVVIINQFLDQNNSFPDKRIASSFDNVSNYLELAIDSIGEPLIKNLLQQALGSWMNSILSVEEKINYYQNCIDRLKSQEENQ